MNGGYCGGVTHLPIPNREVKPAYADGTAMKCGRVGSRLCDEEPIITRQLSDTAPECPNWHNCLIYDED